VFKVEISNCFKQFFSPVAGNERLTAFLLAFVFALFLFQLYLKFKETLSLRRKESKTEVFVQSMLPQFEDKTQ